MVKTKKKMFLCCIGILAALVCCLAFTAFAFAAEPDADINGWVVGDNVHENRGLTAVDGYSSFLLGIDGVTVNDTALDVTKEISFAFRDDGTGKAEHATYVTLADSAAIANWKNMQTVPAASAPLELKLQDKWVTVNRGYVADTPEESRRFSTKIGVTHYLTLYMGTGAEGDVSYVIFDGQKIELAAENMREKFASGEAKFFIWSPNSRGLAMSSPLAPVITSATPQSFNLLSGNEQSLAMQYINAFDGEFTLKAGQYNAEEYTFAADDFTVEPSGQNDGKGTVTLKASAIAKVNWPSRGAYVSVSNAKGTYKQNITVKSGEAPAFVGEQPQIRVLHGNHQSDVAVRFEYADKDTPLLSRGLAPIDKDKRDRAPLQDDGVTLTENGGIYTLTLTKEYLNKCEAGAYWYGIETKNGTLEFPVFTAAESGWQTRAGKGTIEEEGIWRNFTMNGYDFAVDGTRIGGAYSRAGRAFYAEALDVTKPIFIEYGAYTEGGWILFDFNDNPYGVEYCNEIQTATPSKIKVLDMVPNASEPARWGASAGFVSSGVVGMGQYLNSYNNNVLEIGIGKTAEESYFKVNGNDLTDAFRSTGEVTIKQSDFAGGKAYLSIFCATVTSFTMNKNVNAVAVYYPDGEPEYELKSNTDISFDVKNLKNNDLRIEHRGKELVKDTDYSVSGDTVTVKGSFMRTIAFATDIAFTVKSGDTATEVHVPAHSGSSVSNAKIADGESAVKYFGGADIEYKFDLAGETFINVVSGETEEGLNADLYEFSDGALTLKAAALSEKEKGIYGYYLQTEASLVPFYAVHYGFENGYALLGGLTAKFTNGKKFEVSGAGALAIEKMQDLTAGFNATLTVTNTTGYYDTGAPSGNSAAYVAFRFYDVQNGTTAVFRIRPNGAEESAFTRNKLWAEIEIFDANGQSAGNYGTGLRLSAFAANSVRISLSDSQLSVTVADEPSVSLALGDLKFDGKNLLLQVCTEQTAGADKQMEYALEFAEPLQHEQTELQGCGGCDSAVNATAGGIGVTLALSGAALIALRKKSKADDKE